MYMYMHTTIAARVMITVCNTYRWKDPENVFRKHPKLLLTGVPTLIQWGTVSCYYYI